MILFFTQVDAQPNNSWKNQNNSRAQKFAEQKERTQPLKSLKVQHLPKHQVL